jgi:large subunit ribosomal protein L6e
MKNTSRTQSAKAGKRKPWFRGKYSAAAKKEIVKAEATKTPRFYPTEDKKIKLTNNKANNKQTKLKASLVPGAVVILLAGRFKGQRAVFLKQLPSGLCLITGPYKVNGIPLRRVPQSYVIGTSTIVDVSKADTTAVTDCQFKKPKSAKKKSEDGPFAAAEEKKPLDDAAKALQETVDGPVVTAIEAESMLKDYMRARFSLKNGQYPHEMSF